MSSLSVSESVTDYVKLSPHDASKGEIIDGIARAKKESPNRPQVLESRRHSAQLRRLEPT